MAVRFRSAAPLSDRISVRMAVALAMDEGTFVDLVTSRAPKYLRIIPLARLADRVPRSGGGSSADVRIVTEDAAAPREITGHFRFFCTVSVVYLRESRMRVADYPA